MLCRPLTLLDAPHLAVLHEKTAHPWEKAWSKDDYEKFLQQPSISGLSFWDDHAVLLSFILFQKSHVIDILYLATDPSAQRQGFAIALLKHIDSFRMDIFLDVCEENIAAMKLYEKQGFKPISYRKNYYTHNNKNKSCIVFLKKFNDR